MPIIKMTQEVLILMMLLIINSANCGYEYSKSHRQTAESQLTSSNGMEHYATKRNIELIGNTTIIQEIVYFVVASRTIRPGHLYRISVTLLKETQPIFVRASILRNGVEIAEDKRRVLEKIPETLVMKVPSTSVGGNYKLRVEGLYDDILGGSVFLNETKLMFSQRSMSIFIQFDKPMYMQGQNVRFRIIPINTELRGFDDAIDVFVLDPNGTIMRRWLSRQSNLGVFSLDYQLADQLVFGEWTVRVLARGQAEEATFTVDEYYQTRFEVNVTMPSFFFITDRFINGTIMANYTHGGPVVNGNLTLKASIRSLASNIGVGDGSDAPTDRYYHFDEQLPFWFHPRELLEHTFSSKPPHLKFFNGVYDFNFPMADLRESFSDGFEIKITAIVGDKFLDEVIEGYSIARVINSSIKVNFLGGSPQVFKPTMPFTVYIAVTHHDNSLLEKYEYAFSELRVEISTDSSESGGGSAGPQMLTTLTLDPQQQKNGLWECRIDLATLLRKSRQELQNLMQNIDTVHLKAIYNYFESDENRNIAYGELMLVAHESPQNRQIKVTTSTHDARVNENIVFHVQSNFQMSKFQYLVMSKGLILLSDEEEIEGTLKTLAIALSAEMAPSATIIVWHIGKYSDIYADSLTFPVNGLSRNNFSVFINNRKDRVGQRIEVAVYGEPGSYVGLSSIDKTLYTIHAGNELTYDTLLEKMSQYDDGETDESLKVKKNDQLQTLVHSWISQSGEANGFKLYPSSSAALDVNRTFELSGLIVFSNQPLPRRRSLCNRSLGYLECLSSRGQCYQVRARCDGHRDCSDGSDELYCHRKNKTDFVNFRKTRFNRIQRHYENVWIWKDINIGPQGRYLFSVDVPRQPVHWMFSSFSMSPSYGFGMLHKPIEYIGVLPFYVRMEMPGKCRFGEQIGIRVIVFNYMTFANEVTVVLQGSNDYQFVHVEEKGYVTAYNARTSGGDHEFFVYINAQDAKVIYIPVRPSRLGSIDVTVYAVSRFAKDTVTQTIQVESDGLPQYRHQSILLDLSNRASFKQYLHINVTETPVETERYGRYYVFGSNKARISVVGDVVGPVFPTMPYNASSILRLPMDSAEQNMFSLAVNIYTLMYMRFINQRNYTVEKQAFHYMNMIYQRQLSFRNADGSFSLFRSDWNNSYASVWLTAYCADILNDATFNEWENSIFIHPEVIKSAVRWVLQHQNMDGDFYEETWLPDRKVNSSGISGGKEGWSESESKRRGAALLRGVTLTAHVLVMLENVRHLGGEIGTKISLAQARAINWLERKMSSLAQFGRPYDIAVVAYALIHANSPIAETPYIMLAERQLEDGGYRYWSREPIPMPPTKLENQKPFSLPRLPYRYDSETIETTAYALLTYTARQENDLEPIVAWLNSMRLTNSGWASTHDTAIAMKSLIEYTIRKQIRDVSELRVGITATALPGRVTNIYLNNDTWIREKSLDIPFAWGTAEVTAKGAGYALLQLAVEYNVDDEHFLTAPPMQAFDLRTRGNFFGRNQSHIEYLSCVRWISLNESERSGLAVLDISIPTGYIVQQQKLDSYVRGGSVRNLQRARFLREKVVFYFNYVDNHEICINLTVERWYSVANMSRYLPIRVYDYYAPERYNETMFDARSLSTLSICAVCGSSQCPYCPIFSWATRTQLSMYILAFSIFVADCATAGLLFTDKYFVSL